jgi:enoyl-CoA hydratase/carnithine racemase
MDPKDWPERASEAQVLAELRGRVGFVTLNRPQSLNALSLGMIRDLFTVFTRWQHDDKVIAIVLQGQGRGEGKAPAFCAGGDIRFLRESALAGDGRLEDFFTEEYALNHLIPNWGKPVIALMDGVTMGGGMGISQGATLRVVTERSRLAMPETRIGLFPDVGGGWFMARCPGHVGEYLSLTGVQVPTADAIAVNLADVFVPGDALPGLVAALADPTLADAAAVIATVKARAQTPPPGRLMAHRAEIDAVFALPTLQDIAHALHAAGTEFAKEAAAALHHSSPLMMSVTLEQIRRARGMTLAEDLRMERDMVWQCFHRRPGAAGETVEGIRALAVDKDHAPRWNPARIEDVTTGEVALYFESPWSAQDHPLRDL